jgi:hypothetical protein
MNDNKHIQSFGLFKEKLNISDVIESIFDRFRNKDTFIFNGMGETCGLFSGKKWVYVYENPKNGKIKTSVKKIDKYHNGSNPVLTTKN